MYVRPTLPVIGRVGFFVSHQSHPIPSANLDMPPMQHPWSTHGAPMPLIRGYLASLGGASRPPVYPPGTAAHGRVLARSASEAGAERQRSGSRRVHAWPSRSRSTLPLIRAACTALSFARAQHPAAHQRDTPHVQRQKQPSAAATPRCSPLTSLPCCSTWHMAGCSPHVTECAHACSAVPCVTERECPRNGTEGAHARSAVPCVTERECPRNGTEGAHARSAVPCVTERPPLGVPPHALP